MLGMVAAGPAIATAFAASLVEVVEAFTIVLAVGAIRGRRPAALGVATGLSENLLRARCKGEAR